MKIDEIAARLDWFGERFGELKDDGEDFDEEIADIALMSREEYLEFLARRASTPYGRVFASFRELLVPGVVDAYAAADEAGRRELLALLSQRPFVQNSVWAMLERDQWFLEKAEIGDLPGLLRALLRLAVLTGDLLDQVETAVILTRVWRVAEAEKLEPQRLFQEAAEIADRRTGPYGRSAQALLAGFEPYDFGVS